MELKQLEKRGHGWIVMHSLFPCSNVTFSEVDSQFHRYTYTAMVDLGHITF